jgi:hypothetical protein
VRLLSDHSPSGGWNKFRVRLSGRSLGLGGSLDSGSGLRVLVGLLENLLILLLSLDESVLELVGIYLLENLAS